jgi:hypothetical protein
MSSRDNLLYVAAGAAFAGIVVGYLIGRSKKSTTSSVSSASASSSEYSIPNQPQRFARAKAQNNPRYINIDAVYKPEYARGETVLITGGNRGLGLAIAKEYVAQGSTVIVTSRKPATVEGCEVISGIDVTNDDCGSKLVAGLKGRKVDILINNAGYFYGPQENFKNLNFKEEMSMIDICAVGPLRITAALFNAGLLATGAKVTFLV